MGLRDVANKTCLYLVMILPVATKINFMCPFVEMGKLLAFGFKS
jgi:hypothetical protein